MEYKRLTSAVIRAFRRDVYRHYQLQGRDLPWRKTRDPYRIMVSEIMLQQTQVDRVIEKYRQFTKVFPDFETLARARLKKLLVVWQGMGYNRRAIFLQRTARAVVEKFGGKLPRDPDIIERLPGIGPNTARSICAFAFSMPVVFIETNIRTIFIHRFFKGRTDVRDTELLPLIEQTLDRTNPCRWYNALMDYGVILKKKHPNPSRRSSHYQRQSRFEGSNRQMRGKIVRLLTVQSYTAAELFGNIGGRPAVIRMNINRLRAEGFIREKKDRYVIA